MSIRHTRSHTKTYFLLFCDVCKRDEFVPQDDRFFQTLNGKQSGRGYACANCGNRILVKEVPS